MTDEGPSLWIKSCPARDGAGRLVCSIAWGPLSWVAPVDLVHRTALDMVTCANLADLLMLMRARLPLEARQITDFVGLLCRSVLPPGQINFGSPDTVQLAVGGSSITGQGAVMVRHGAMSGSMSTGEARDMALGWMSAAETTEGDAALHELLSRRLGLGEPAMAWLFTRLAQIRTGQPAPAGVPTSERLARALEERDDPRLAAMVANARAGVYDDFRSPEPAPIVRLVEELRALGLNDLAHRAISGEFDASPEEAQTWLDSPEGQNTLRELIHGAQRGDEPSASDQR